MAKNFRCKIITPEAAVLDDEVKYAMLPLWDGLAGFESGHSPLVAKLGVGELRLDFDDNGKTASRYFFVTEGFCRFEADELTILAHATAAEELSDEDAMAELRAAEARTVHSDSKDPAAEMDRITSDRDAARQKLALAKELTTLGI